MVFSSSVFLFAFLPVTLVGYYILFPALHNSFLLVMSLLFYAYGEPRFVFVMLISILCNYGFALLCAKAPDGKLRKIILAASVAFNCSIFFVYKYLNFVLRNLNIVLGGALRETSIALPIGISFFTFQAMSYVFDVYRNRSLVQRNPLNVALYITLFPQLIAGPIVRYETVAKEIKSRATTWDDFTGGVYRFITGLTKKVILANSLALMADYAFGCGDTSRISVLMAWMGSLAYSLQIYYDFSSYSDMAIGLGLMFGFHFEENFRYPYTACSITDFWRRWHISLSAWFRDYVYIPLGGSRVKSRGRRTCNLFVVWMLTGIWHGASWNFVVWGLFYFVLLAVEKAVGLPEWLQESRRLGGSGQKIAAGAYRLFTLLAVNFGWVLFRADDLNHALGYLGAMFGAAGNAVLCVDSVYFIKSFAMILALAVLFACPILQSVQQGLGPKLDRYQAPISCLRQCIYIALFVICISFSVSGAYDPFIYFNF